MMLIMLLILLVLIHMQSAPLSLAGASKVPRRPTAQENRREQETAPNRTCVCMYMCVYTYIYTCMHIYVYMYVYMCMYAYIHI